MTSKISFIGAAAVAVALFTGFSAPAAHAAFVYSSGPVNGSIEGRTISSPFSVADSFTLTSGADINTVLFYSWEIAGNHETSVDWAITSSAFGPAVASGVANPLTAVVFPVGQFDSGQIGANYYDIDSNAFTTNVDLAAGTYWLELSNATDTTYVSYWDVNNGKGSAFQTTSGPSGAYSTGVNSFNLYGGAYVPTPEASSYIGLLLGVAGLAAFAMFSAKRKSSIAA